MRSSTAAYWIEDADGTKFAFIYFEERVLPIGTEYTCRLTRREALMIVRNIAKLPEILDKG